MNAENTLSKVILIFQLTPNASKRCYQYFDTLDDCLVSVAWMCIEDFKSKNDGYVHGFRLDDLKEFFDSIHDLSCFVRTSGLDDEGNSKEVYKGYNKNRVLEDFIAMFENALTMGKTVFTKKFEVKEFLDQIRKRDNDEDLNRCRVKLEAVTLSDSEEERFCSVSARQNSSSVKIEPKIEANDDECIVIDDSGDESDEIQALN